MTELKLQNAVSHGARERPRGVFFCAKLVIIDNMHKKRAFFLFDIFLKSEREI